VVRTLALFFLFFFIYFITTQSTITVENFFHVNYFISEERYYLLQLLSEFYEDTEPRWLTYLLDTHLYDSERARRSNLFFFHDGWDEIMP
jgi:hypothetical protein